MNTRFKCSECDFVFSVSLKAPHPFAEDETLEFCPACKDVATGRLLCQVAGCDNVASCGEPTPDGFRHVCWRHRASV